MLFGPRQSYSRAQFTFDNLSANPSTSIGTSVVPGVSAAEGSWTQVATSANIAQNVFGILVYVSNGNSSTIAKLHAMDIGVDPAGGTSYTAVINDILCGLSGGPVNGKSGHPFYFPLFIKSGSSVAVRVMGSHTTAGTVRVMVKFFGKLSGSPEFVGSVAQTIGMGTPPNGTVFTPGNSADGAWQSLGTTTRHLWWWNLGVQVNDATTGGEQTYVELAYGDGTNKHQILRKEYNSTSAEILQDFTPGGDAFASLGSFCSVPSGATLYVRGRCNNAPDSGYQAAAIGMA